MTGKTAYLSIEDFNQRAECDVLGSECKVNNLIFRKDKNIGQEEIKQVLDTCNELNNSGINTLIVKAEKELIIWIESNPTSSTAQSGLPTKTVTRRYRGQVYEETVVDWAAVQGINQAKKDLKYRGQNL